MADPKVDPAITKQLTYIRKQGMLGLDGKDMAGDSLAHLKALDGIRPKVGLTVEFCEAFVAHSIVSHTRPARAYNLFYTFRDDCIANGRKARFTRFENKVNAYLGDTTFSPHGFMERRLESVDTDLVYSTLQKITEKFDSIGYQVFANAGTLLGLVRDGKLIAHDDDIDLVVMLDVRSDEDAVAEWRTLPAKLKAIGVEVKGDSDDASAYKLPSIDGFDVDLFPAWGTYRRYNIYPYSRKKLHFLDISPLQKCEVSGLNLPARPEVVLKLNYGEGWKVPDPGFRLPWGKYKKSFKTFLNLLDAR